MPSSPYRSTSVPEVFSVKQWDTHDMDLDFGVPGEHLQEIASTVIATLEQMGIDRDNVLFSGYNPNIPKEETDGFAGNGETGDDIKKLLREMGRLEASGDFDINPSLKKEYVDRLLAFKAERKKQEGQFTYFLSKWDTLFDNSESGKDSNPLNYASVDEDATLGVYDKAKLQDLTGEDISKDGVVTIMATPEQMDEAKILEFHPRYNTDIPALSH